MRLYLWENKPMSKRKTKAIKKRIAAMQKEQGTNKGNPDTIVKDKTLQRDITALGYRLNTKGLFQERITENEGKRQTARPMQKTHSRDANKSLYEYTKPRYSAISKRKTNKTVFDNCTNKPKG
jgi:hypothetical protein